LFYAANINDLLSKLHTGLGLVDRENVSNLTGNAVLLRKPCKTTVFLIRINFTLLDLLIKSSTKTTNALDWWYWQNYY